MVKVRKDLTGMKFGHLLVKRQADDYVCNEHHYAQWLVECDCGKSNEFPVRDAYLRKGHTKSCGCIKKRNGRVKSKKDLSRIKFGRLTVICQADDDYVNPNGQHESKWWVVCDCGNSDKFTVRYGHLISGNTKSCGCLAVENGKLRKKYNTYDLSKDFGIGYTSKGEEFWFDLEDYEKIKDYCWYYSNDGYLCTNIIINEDKRGLLYFHRIIMDFPKGKIDYILHGPKYENKHDNRKSNLRVVTNSQDAMNKHKQRNNTSGVVGVSWNSNHNQWESRINLDYQCIHLGYFKNKEDAVKARKIAEDIYFGEYSFESSGNKYEEEDAS